MKFDIEILPFNLGFLIGWEVNENKRISRVNYYLNLELYRILGR
jgi:hypothetical protein